MGTATTALRSSGSASATSAATREALRYPALGAPSLRRTTRRSWPASRPATGRRRAPRPPDRSRRRPPRRRGMRRRRARRRPRRKPPARHGAALQVAREHRHAVAPVHLLRDGRPPAARRVRRRSPNIARPTSTTSTWSRLRAATRDGSRGRSASATNGLSPPADGVVSAVPFGRAADGAVSAVPFGRAAGRERERAHLVARSAVAYSTTRSPDGANGAPGHREARRRDASPRPCAARS